MLRDFRNRLLDRKLNHLIGVVLIAVALGFGVIVYFGLRGWVGDEYAFVAAVMVAWLFPLLMEIWFRRSDP
jgi:hypothetical protein